MSARPWLDVDSKRWAAWQAAAAEITDPDWLRWIYHAADTIAVRIEVLWNECCPEDLYDHAWRAVSRDKWVVHAIAFGITNPDVLASIVHEPIDGDALWLAVRNPCCPVHLRAIATLAE